MGERMFSQDEVNAIVSERLKRVKNQTVDADNNQDEPNAGIDEQSKTAVQSVENNSEGLPDNDIDSREKAVLKRENALKFKAYLDTFEHMSADQKNAILETVTAEDSETFKKKADLLISALGMNEKKPRIIGKTSGGSSDDDRLRSIFLQK